MEGLIPDKAMTRLSAKEQQKIERRDRKTDRRKHGMRVQSRKQFEDQENARRNRGK